MQGVTPKNRHVTSLTHAFLNVHWDRKRPLLLGYSGGPDSKALLYTLLECGITPHLAHVDHGWREESRFEAEMLREEAAKLNCPFFSTRLTIAKKEDDARKGRLAFFSSLIEPYQALLLGHQADDLAETVLKRILEGAHLSNLSAMQPISQHQGMAIWRPFLKIRRSEILQFLEERSLTPLIDSSNSDPIYLRSRLRLDIFPFLNQHFGKEIVDNLTLLSERAQELKNYLEKQTADIPIQKGAWIDLNGLEPIEQRHLLLKIARAESITLNRSHLETLLKWIEERISNHLTVKTRKIWVEKGRVCCAVSKSLSR